MEGRITHQQIPTPPQLSPSLSAIPFLPFSSTPQNLNLISHLMAAQRTEEEDTDFKKVPEAPLSLPLCLNDCGLSGSPSTNNLCPKCFHASSERAQRSSSPPLSTVRKPISVTSPTGLFPRTRGEVNRCSGCRRKVGLTGFRCRCGELFCGDHRYSDRHDCGYDYKAAGREAITRENPIIKAAKIVRV